MDKQFEIVDKKTEYKVQSDKTRIQDDELSDEIEIHFKDSKVIMNQFQIIR